MAVVVKTNGIPFRGRCTPQFSIYFSGDWDLQWGYDLDFDPWPLMQIEWTSDPFQLCRWWFLCFFVVLRGADLPPIGWSRIGGLEPNRGRLPPAANPKFLGGNLRNLNQRRGIPPRCFFLFSGSNCCCCLSGCCLSGTI